MEYLGEGMIKSKKFIIALMLVLVPAIGLGFNWFNSNDKEDINNEALTVKGGITTANFEASNKIVPGDQICGAIKVNVESTAKSLLRVKINPYYSESKDGEKIYDEVATIDFVQNDKWIKSTDGYYYYKEAVSKENNTSIDFINSIVFSVDNLKDANTYQGKYIGVELQMDMIQAEHGVYKEAWSIGEGHEMAETFKLISDSLSNN